MAKKTCKWCGREYESGARGSSPIYCCKKCENDAKDSKRKK